MAALPLSKPIQSGIETSRPSTLPTRAVMRAMFFWLSARRNSVNTPAITGTQMVKLKR